MDSVQQILGKVLRKRGLESEAKASQAVFAAERILKDLLPKVSEFLKPQKLDRGTLYIEAAHSIAAQECQGRLQDILSALNMELGDGSVRDVRLVRS